MKFQEKVLGSGTTTAYVHSDGMVEIDYDPADSEAKYMYLDQENAKGLRDFLNEVYPPKYSLKELYTEMQTASEAWQRYSVRLSNAKGREDAYEALNDAMAAGNSFLQAKIKFEKALNQTHD